MTTLTGPFILKRSMQFLVSFCLGALITIFITSAINHKQEKELREEMEFETIYIVAFLKRNIPNLTDDALNEAFVRYVNEVKRDKWIVAEKGRNEEIADIRIDHFRSGEYYNDGLLLHELPGDKYMLTYKVGDRDMDIFASREYYYDHVSEVDPLEIVPGLIIMVISIAAQIAYSDKKLDAETMKERYESETSALTKTLKEHEALALIGRMVSALAHELKTPVATISNLIQTLPSRASDKTFLQRFVVLVKKELSRSQQLIDNLLMYGKDISTLQEEWVDLRTLVNEAAAPLNHLTVACADAKLLCDRFYMSILFKNIFKNSINAGAGSISVTIAPESGESVRIQCQDNGRGFPGSAELSDLIEPFVTNRSSGAGLGLYLVRKIVTAHQGSVLLVAREGGALVQLIIPAARVRAHG